MDEDDFERVPLDVYFVILGLIRRCQEFVNFYKRGPSVMGWADLGESADEIEECLNQLRSLYTKRR